ncbi:MAG TPA: carboxypeptidase-like regulatory domain-containing protein [Vicinamibacterales bacterium]|nr:carboxypeptidase-like regulatory domain-containing protein [Vicinamibacterales bacterium]
MTPSVRTRVKTAVGLGTLAAVMAVMIVGVGAQRSTPTGFIGGTVRSAQGPEGGVWVIAETKELPTNFIKIVVTDDRGRFMLPELPAASYSVWVRGYGLVDSKPVTLKPGAADVQLMATQAKTPAEAAKVYPADYWLSLLEPPAKSEFPGTGPKGNGIGPAMLTQNHYINSLKSDCNFCHQLGNQLTRSVDHVLKAKPELKTHAEAWEWRLGTGVRGTSMYAVLNTQGKDRLLKTYADWTERIAKGEVPPAPARPKGVERNVVVTLWDVGDDHSFMHDEIATDKNRPTVNAGGNIYAVSAGHGQLVVLDPNGNRTESLDIPTREPREKVPSRFPAPNRPSLHWGNQHLWANPPYNPADPHNPMLDSKGRVWMTSKIRSNADPSWCASTDNKFAAWFPLKSSGRQASFYDPKTKQFVLIDTCYSTHHLQFDNDANETVYFNELIGPIFGWVDSKVYDQTKDEQKANGWCGQVLDTNGDGKITRPWNVSRSGNSALYLGDTAGAANSAQNTALDPKLDTMVTYSLYAVIPSPVDDSVWGVSEQYPGFLVRLQRGNNPPESCKSTVFKVPEPGFDPRGVDIDRNGVVWTALAASSHMASFDVRKCKDLNGPAKLDGSQCREGWTLYQTTGPKLKGTDIPADFHYYNWVDQYNIAGFGANTPFATGSNSDALLALNPQTKEWTTLRVPYPLGFYSRGMDGRIDDPRGGWKGRALYANYGTHFVWHIEGGKGTKGKVVKFQVRPDPLAR